MAKSSQIEILSHPAGIVDKPTNLIYVSNSQINIY